MKRRRGPKLEWAQVLIIRRLRGFYIQNVIGAAFGVTQQHVSLIQLRKRWK